MQNICKILLKVYLKKTYTCKNWRNDMYFVLALHVV